MSYATHIMGKDAIYNLELLNAVEIFGAEFRRQKYLASWRILHVDGFETASPRLPAHTGRQIQFFSTYGVTQSGLRKDAERMTGVPAALFAPYGVSKTSGFSDTKLDT